MSTTVLVKNLHFPTSVAVTEDGEVFVAESGLAFGDAPPGGRVWRIHDNGDRDLIIDGLRAPVSGLTVLGSQLLLTEGGHPGRISLLSKSGQQQVVLDGLPGLGNYHTNMAVGGPDRWLYFGQGALTNSGIVGLDSYEIGWLARLPHAHDVPGLDIKLRTLTVETPNPLNPTSQAPACTGAFSPFGSAHPAGQRLAATVPATAAVMRVRPDGSDLQLVSWGLRNAWALGFLRDGRLIAIDQGADDRGSRPIGNAPDVLFEVRSGAWYGWPDFIAAEPVTHPRFTPTRGPAPQFVLDNHDELPTPEAPLLEFEPHVAAVKFDQFPEDSAAHAGDLLVALFGDETPMTTSSHEPRGRTLTCVDTTTWQLRPVGHELELARPIDVRFHPSGESVFLLDFGKFEMTPDGVAAEAGTGRLWQVPVTGLEL
jgi:glucose/arabinose dehydrogenase